MTELVEKFPADAAFIFIDTETTGLIRGGKVPFPIQVGLVFCDKDFKVVHEFSRYFYTREDIQTSSFRVHGIGRKKLAMLVRYQNGLSKEDDIYDELGGQEIVFMKIVKFLQKTDAFVCAHNLGFDFAALTRAVSEKFFVENPLSTLKNPICTLRNDDTKKATPDHYGAYWFKSLDNLAKSCGVKFKRPREHCALKDCHVHMLCVESLYGSNFPKGGDAHDHEEAVEIREKLAALFKPSPL